jgi:acetyl/propionyl-CoA carboxylase alpha subunit
MTQSTSVVTTKPIRRVLIANRGEVAVRVAGTLRGMGISVVTIYTEADESAKFISAGDISYCIGAAGNYINIEAVVNAAKATQSDAIHPGYGFLSENAKFASAVIQAGIIFIGPLPETIANLGSKIGAKTILAKTAPDIPLIPGYYRSACEPELTPAQYEQKAVEIGFPVLIKAAAGGGGKGMRVVRRREDFASALDSVRTEARGAFGDDTLFLERFFENVRHIEVQIIGDAYNNVAHLFDRECSVQRRHQKLVEECPSSALSPAMREKICGCAVRVGQSVNYRNAGTVEFIYQDNEKGGEGSFFFLEVNTRLQVEHGVTERCVNIDIVRTQVLVASGFTIYDALVAAQRVPNLSLRPGESPIPRQPFGHSIEVRVYAEDDSFRPQIGRISGWSLSPDADYHTATAVGSNVGISYDGLIAKVIVHAPDGRRAAVDKLIAALRRMCCFGVWTNRMALINLLQHERVNGGNMSTDMIDKGIIPGSALIQPLRSTVAAHLPIAVKAMLIASQVISLEAEAARTLWKGVRSGWSNTGGRAIPIRRSFLVKSAPTTYDKWDLSFTSDAATGAPKITLGDGTAVDFNAFLLKREFVENNVTFFRVCYKPLGRAEASTNADETAGGGPAVGEEELVATQVVPIPSHEDAHAWPNETVVRTINVQFLESGTSVILGHVDPLGGLVPGTLSAQQGDALPAQYSASAGDSLEAGAVASPIPGKVVKVLVTSGGTVKKGDVVVVLESMKMESKLAAPRDGVVTIRVKPGDLVSAGKAVFVVSAAS